MEEHGTTVDLEITDAVASITDSTVDRGSLALGMEARAEHDRAFLEGLQCG